MLYLRRFTRLLFVLLFTLLLGMSFSTIHSRPAFAATCVGASWQYLNSDTKIQYLPTYRITVHTVLEEQIGNTGFCGRLHAVTHVTLDECEASPTCNDHGTATAFLVANGTTYSNTGSISLTAPAGGFATEQVTSPPPLASCGAAGGNYKGSEGENITSGSAQRCG